MSVTIRVAFEHSSLEFKANEFELDMSYMNFYEFCNDIGISAKSEGGTVGEIDIKSFRDKCEEYPVSGMFPEHVIRLLKLCRLGIAEGATHIVWS